MSKSKKPQNIYSCSVQFNKEVRIVPGGFTRSAHTFVRAKDEEQANKKVVKHYENHSIIAAVTETTLAQQDPSEYLTIIQ